MPFPLTDLPSTPALLAGDAAADDRQANGAEWVVWAYGEDGTAHEMNATGPQHAGELAGEVLKPGFYLPGAPAIIKAEVRRTQPNGDTEKYGVVYPPTYIRVA